MSEQLRGVLLDIDGTLLDSNDAHALSWVEAFEKVGEKIAFDRVRPLIGMGGDKVMQMLAGVPEDSADGHAISDRRKAIFMQEHLPSLRPFDGARDLCVELEKRGLRLVVATSASGEELDGLLKQTGIDDLIDESATKSDAARSKPDVDIVAAAVRKSALPPRELVMLGDTPYDVEASRKAGVRAIGFRCGGHSDEALAGAAEIYDGPRDLLRRFDESLLGRFRETPMKPTQMEERRHTQRVSR
jgi:HAD superfamily hydrolase (TIGR01509 family)